MRPFYGSKWNENCAWNTITLKPFNDRNTKRFDDHTIFSLKKQRCIGLLLLMIYDMAADHCLILVQYELQSHMHITNTDAHPYTNAVAPLEMCVWHHFQMAKWKFSLSFVSIPFRFIFRARYFPLRMASIYALSLVRYGIPACPTLVRACVRLLSKIY